MSPAEFASALMGYCMGTQASVTSWGRTAAHNTHVGGLSDSAHLLWIAADVVYDGEGLPVAVANTDHEALATRLGLMLIHEGDHDHVQPIR